MTPAGEASDVVGADAVGADATAEGVDDGPTGLGLIDGMQAATVTRAVSAVAGMRSLTPARGA
jgi:hypothetical protein